MMHVTAIILAAGEGRRIGGDYPKSYLPIAGRPLVLRTLDRMFSAPSVETVVLVVAAEQARTLRVDVAFGCGAARIDRWLSANRRRDAPRIGKARSGEVGSDADIVIIHDGARPFVSAGSSIVASTRRRRSKPWSSACRYGIRSNRFRRTIGFKPPRSGALFGKYKRRRYSSAS